MIGLVKDRNSGWWKHFSQELEKRQLPHRMINIERSDWLEQVDPCKALIWRPNLTEPYCTQAREKLYFLENVAGKKVYPSQSTWWHYNSKRAQAYLGKKYKIRMPETLVSYSYEEAMSYLRQARFPLVSKGSGGASSKNVRLLRSNEEALRELNLVFGKGLWNRLARRILAKFGLHSNRFSGQKSYVYYQEFLARNDIDYRVTTIGPDLAFAFSRRNRPGDFRASGSGNIDYDCSHDLEAIKYCLQISQDLNFDTMCYDILYKDGKFVIGEFSYTFVGKAVFDCPGYFRLEDGNLKFIEGHVWPETLIIKYLIEKWNL